MFHQVESFELSFIVLQLHTFWLNFIFDLASVLLDKLLLSELTTVTTSDKKLLEETKYA